MRKAAFLAAVLFALAIGSASGQAPSPEGTPAPVRGTVEKLDGQTLTVKARNGQTVTVALNPDFTVRAVAKRSLADIKPGDYVATTSIKGTDGQLHAIEVHIFPEAMQARVTEGQRPSSLVEGGLMTNAFVVEVTETPEGRVLKGKWKDGTIETIVEPTAPIVTYVPGDPSLLRPGAAVTIFGQKKPDGTVNASNVTAEKDGVKPPM
ncbi:MAG: hypothetical protein JO162_04850 [Alphaproteobacteria bacterium]|nr:hypothetical protein [Alphaproteobacteria bacterium]MBV9014449.1 hypothetical protein [Alphaproteobacteria bacterium]MBV9153284.1 hypothetical protein [Alphaproteobacteria bacterium]MBV9583445.1 hypothetical protein [Alphaproteobacteria bacterium]MBV9966186.1 hypothetical protein [Alphaproteobacteria bacterium]